MSADDWDNDWLRLCALMVWPSRDTEAAREWKRLKRLLDQSIWEACYIPDRLLDGRAWEERP